MYTAHLKLFAFSFCIWGIWTMSFLWSMPAGQIFPLPRVHCISPVITTITCVTVCLFVCLFVYALCSTENLWGVEEKYWNLIWTHNFLWSFAHPKCLLLLCTKHFPTICNNTCTKQLSLFNDLLHYERHNEAYDSHKQWSVILEATLTDGLFLWWDHF